MPDSDRGESHWSAIPERQRGCCGWNGAGERTIRLEQIFPFRQFVNLILRTCKVFTPEELEKRAQEWLRTNPPGSSVPIWVDKAINKIKTPVVTNPTAEELAEMKD